MIHLLKLAILPALLLLVNADLPIDTEVPIFSRNDEDVISYRIPESLDPIHYDVEITPYFEATADRAAFSFDGIVTMTMRAVEADITEIILQDNVRTISGLTVMDANGVPLLLNETLPIERIRQYQILKINLRDGVVLENGATYIIRILYVGHMNETPLSRGMFRGSYVGADGTTHWYAATHLQATHGRQLFPCLDEPGFKSTFAIIVNRLPSYNGTFSNMHILESVTVGDRVRDTFITTPRMSAYLVTIHISEEFEVIADNNDSERSYRIIARPTARGQGEYALEVGPPLTEWLETYLGVPYYGMGENMKNDQLASPYWASGATENWGLVTYRELRLLYEEGETNDVDKMSVATITAHELAHKWFGNLVTARWWDNVWINEGYASYFEYFAMDAVDPTMELDDQFNIMYLQSSLSADSAVGTRALQHTVNSPAEVTGHFSGISYTKGASLLNMLKHFLTEETFRKALEYYLVDMSYEHAYPEDVYRGFERAVQEDGVLSAFSNINITNFLNYWVDEPGYPIVDVNYDVSSGVISLEQERFFISATVAQTEQVWTIPITYTTEGNPDWDQTRATHVMTEGTLEIQKDAVDEWVIFNVKQNGIYRVNYNEHNWHLIAAALKEDINSIHYLNRAQIVDDIFALMRSGRMTYALGFHVLDFLKSETNYIVWYPAITGLSWLRNRFLHLEGTLQEFENIILGFLETVVADLGFNQGADDSLTRNLNRLYVLAFACNVGHPDCISDALDKFIGLYSNSVSVNPNLRRHVYCQGLRLGGYEEWSFLHQLRLSGNNQANDLVMLRGLGCTNNEQAVQQYLETILTPDVKAQDRVNAFTFLFMGGRSNTRLALEFIKERHNEIREAVVDSSWFSSILANMAAYMDEEGLQAMEDWLNAEQANIPEYAVGISSINSARTSMQWGDNMADEVLAAVRDSATAAVPAALLLAMSLLVLMMQ